jgi:hypothetical protein
VRQNVANGISIAAIAALLGMRPHVLYMRRQRQQINARTKAEEAARKETLRNLKLQRDAETAANATIEPFERMANDERNDLIARDAKFQALLLAAGATPGVCTEPGTENPKFVKAPSAGGLRSSSYSLLNF